MGIRKSVTVIARRWYDGTNTYHSVKVLYNGVQVGLPSRMTYGYGDAFLQTACEILNESKLFKGVEMPLTLWARNNKVNLHIDVVDVARRKDLH